jgi:hypothetical protein
VEDTWPQWLLDALENEVSPHQREDVRRSLVEHAERANVRFDELWFENGEVGCPGARIPVDAIGVLPAVFVLLRRVEQDLQKRKTQLGR